MPAKHEPLLARIPLLVPINNLPSSQQETLTERARVIELRRKEYIFRQGDRDEWSYYVLEGEIEMYADDQLIKRVKGGEGESFHALAQLQPRQMSARAKTKVKILQLNRNLLDRLLSAEVEPAGCG